MQHRPELDRWILAAAGPKDRTFLDVGCGLGHTGFLLWAEGFGSHRIGVDVDAEYLDRARSLGVYGDVRRADLNDGLPDFETDSFDAVLCIAVLTTLAEGASNRLLDECERVARERVLVTVATGGTRPHPERPLEGHRSVWRASDLTKRGYEVTGFGSALSRDRHAGRRFLYGWYGGTLAARLSVRVAEELLAVRVL